MSRIFQIQDISVTHLVRKYHDAVVGLASHRTADALRCVTHGVERQEVILAHAQLITQVLETRA